MLRDETPQPSRLYLTQPGLAHMRWRGVMACIERRLADPRHDRFVAHVFDAVDVDTAAHLADAWLQGYADAPREMRELALEHPHTEATTTKRRSRIHAIGLWWQSHEAQSKLGCLSARQAGWLAFLKGIDRSPWHDIAMSRVVRKERDQEMVTTLLRAWEQGWDHARLGAEQLPLERPIDEAPRVSNARRIRSTGGEEDVAK